MKFTPIAALVMTSLAAFAQSASAQSGAEGRMNFLRDARTTTSGPQFEFSRLPDTLDWHIKALIRLNHLERNAVGKLRFARAKREAT